MGQALTCAEKWDKRNGQKVVDRKLHLKMRKFLLRVAEHWKRRPRETVEIFPGDAQKLSGHSPG